MTQNMLYLEPTRLWKEDVCVLKSGRSSETVSLRKGAMTRDTVKDFVHCSSLVLRNRVRRKILRFYLLPRPTLAFLSSNFQSLSGAWHKQNCHRSLGECAPSKSDATRQLDCAADRVPEFGHTCPVVHELAVGICWC